MVSDRVCAVVVHDEAHCVCIRAIYYIRYQLHIQHTGKANLRSFESRWEKRNC